MPPASDNLPIRLPDQKKLANEAATLRKIKRYLLLRSQGKLFYEACKAADIPTQTIQTWRYSNPQFKDAENNSRREGAERVEAMLRDAAEEGTPWAVDKYLQAHVPELYGNKVVHEHRLDVSIDAANHLKKISDLRSELERRRRDIPQSVVDENPFINDVVIVDAELIVE